MDYNKVIALNPKYAPAYFNRGVSKGKLLDYNGAIADYTKAIEINPTDGQFYYHRGLAKGCLKDKNGGCWDLSKAGELGYKEAYEAIKELCQ